MFSQLVTKLRRMIIGRSTVEALLEDERRAAQAAELNPACGSQEEAATKPAWIRTHTLDDPILSVEEMRWLKRRRALLNYGNGFEIGEATESDLDCLTQEERDRLESIEIQVRWDQFLGRPIGVDVKPGRYHP